MIHLFSRFVFSFSLFNTAVIVHIFETGFKEDISLVQLQFLTTTAKLFVANLHWGRSKIWK